MLPILLVTLPFFALIACGYIASRLQWLPCSAVPGLNAFVLYFALPCMLFRVGLQTPLMATLDPIPFAVYLVAGLSLVMLVMSLPRHRKVTPRDMALGALTATFPNSGFIGLALLTSLIGPSASGPIIMTLLIDIVIISTVCIALTRRQVSRHLPWHQSVAQTLRSTARNPLPWAVVAGFGFAQTGLPLPSPVQQTLDMLAHAASPVALFTIGAVLWRSTERADDPTPASAILLIALIKLAIHPLLVLMLGIVAFQHGATITIEQIQVLTLVAALPSASNVALLAEHYYANAGRIARIVMVSTVMAFASFPTLAWLLLSKSMH